MATRNDTRAAAAHPSPAAAFELIERLRRLTDKLEVVADRFKEAEAASRLPDGFFGEIFITLDVAEELGHVVCELDEWARANGAPKFGMLTAAETSEDDEETRQ